MIIANPAIHKIEFIGSAAMGRSIGQVAAKYLKPVLMELGGKAPATVLKDVDLKRAAALCVQGATMHHGQICMSTERIIVVKEVSEEVIKHLNDAALSMKGDTGFAVTKAMAPKAQKLIDDALEHGATSLVGGNQERGGSGAALVPTFITGVKSGNPVHDIETFGPSATVYLVADEKEAIELANDESRPRQHEAKRALRALRPKGDSYYVHAIFSLPCPRTEMGMTDISNHIGLWLIINHTADGETATSRCSLLSSQRSPQLPWCATK